MTADRDALREQIADALADLGIDVYGRIDHAVMHHIDAYIAQVLEDALRAAVADVRRAAGVSEPDGSGPASAKPSRTEPSTEDMDAPVAPMPKSVRRWTMRPSAEGATPSQELLRAAATLRALADAADCDGDWEADGLDVIHGAAGLMVADCWSDEFAALIALAASPPYVRLIADWLEALATVAAQPNAPTRTVAEALAVARWVNERHPDGAAT